MHTETAPAGHSSDVPQSQRRLALARRLSAAAATVVLVVLGATLWAALKQPWLGVHLEVQGAAVIGSGLPGVPGPVHILSVHSGAGPEWPLMPQDLVEEPDMLPSYAAWADFYQRQDAFARALRSGPVRIHYTAAGQQGSVVLTAAARRPLGSLPPVFWFQLLVGATGALVGSWVLGLRPGDGAARCLGLTGLGLLGAAATAAFYSTRELALPLGEWVLASTLNHLATIGFGVGLVGIFLFHPRQLASVRVFAAMALIWSAWAVADVAWWLPTPDVGMRSIILTELGVAFALGILQWRRARKHPADRAALRWVLLSFLVGCGIFVALIVCTTMLGWLPPLSQGWSFGFFLVMYLGLALGVRRYRLFELDRWSLHVLMWLFGLVGIVTLDAALLFMQFNEVFSLAASALICAALYFPLRQRLWEKVLRARTPAFEDVASSVVALALAPQARQQQLWESFWARLYQPMRVDVESLPGTGQPAVLLDHGLGMRVPATAGLPAVQLWHGRMGRRLFSGDDLTLTAQLAGLLGVVAEARQAREDGALQERRRIAADLHDDLGSKLLSIAQARDFPRASALAREALEDLRLAVNGMLGADAPVEHVVADWRAETAQRAEAAELQLQWDAAVADGTIGPRPRIQTTRMLREAVTNVIKHSRATQLQVRVQSSASRLQIEISDDGVGLVSGIATGGHGLAGMARRAHSLGGSCSVAPLAPAGTCVRIDVPLADAQGSEAGS